MKFLHLADLHIGKRLMGYSFLEDQAAILRQIVQLAEQHGVDVVLICGDVYDTAVPPASAVRLLDTFLNDLLARGIQVCMISGNHDSSIRLDFGSRQMRQAGLYISSIYPQTVEPVTFQDAWGTYDVWMIPFIKPADLHLEKTPETYTEMFETVLGTLEKAPGHRNVLMAHQFIRGCTRCDSEELTIGTLDDISTDAIRDFDYAAFGHLHSPQKCGWDHCRYAGSPLKYSISEADHPKSVPLITMEEETVIELLDLHPIRDLRQLEGTLEELTDPAFVKTQNTEDYLYFRLKDREELHDPIGRLRRCYPHALGLDYLFRKDIQEAPDIPRAEQMNPLELMNAFYTRQKGVSLSDSQLDVLAKMWKEVQG